MNSNPSAEFVNNKNSKYSRSRPCCSIMSSSEDVVVSSSGESVTLPLGSSSEEESSTIPREADVEYRSPNFPNASARKKGNTIIRSDEEVYAGIII